MKQKIVVMLLSICMSIGTLPAAFAAEAAEDHGGDHLEPLTADAFAVSDSEVSYNGLVQEPTVVRAREGEVGDFILTFGTSDTREKPDTSIAPKNAGTYIMWVTAEAGSKYAAGTVKLGNFVINKAVPTVTVEADQSNVSAGEFEAPVIAGLGEDALNEPVKYTYEGETTGVEYTDAVAALAEKTGTVEITWTYTPAGVHAENYNSASGKITASLLDGIKDHLLTGGSMELSGSSSKEYDGEAANITVTKVSLKDSTEAINPSNYDVKWTKKGGIIALDPSKVKDAGEYTISVTGKGDYRGTIKETYTITPKEITVQAKIQGEDSAAIPYGTVLADSELTVTAAAGALVKDETAADLGMKLAVFDENEIKQDLSKALPAGIYTVKSDGKAANKNYAVTVTPATLTVSKVRLEGKAVKVTKNGTAIGATQNVSVGDELTASVEGMESGLTFTWQAGDHSAEGPTYTVKPADSGKNLTVSVAADNANFDGTPASATVIVQKMTVSGSIVIKVDDKDGEGIGAGDVLTAVANIEPEAAVAGGSWQWLKDGGPMEGETGNTYTVDLFKTGNDSKITVKFLPGADFKGEVVSADGVIVGKKALNGAVSITGEGQNVGDKLALNGIGMMPADLKAGRDYTIAWYSGETRTSITANEYTITESDLGKTIKVIVKGTGDITGTLEAAKAIRAQKPAKPVITVTAGNRKATVKWSAVADHGSAITGYTLTITHGIHSKEMEIAADKTSYVVEELTNDTKYTFVLTAANKIGKTESDEKTCTPVSGSTGGNTGGGSSSSSSKPSATPKPSPLPSKPTTTTTVDAAGKTEVKVELPSSTVTDAIQKDETISLPMPEVAVTKDAAKAPTVTISTPTISETVRVEVPVEKPTPGTVAVLVKSNGTEEIVKMSAVTEDGVTLPITGGCTVKILDNSKSFNDMADSWAKDSVDFVTARELFKGTSAVTFDPQANMTRGMLVTVLFRLDGEKKGNENATFSDVAGDTWYADAVTWAAGKGIVTGVGGGRFAPNDSITREQLCTMIYRYARMMGFSGTMGSISSFPDADSVSNWASEAMAWCVGSGIINGKSGALAPQDTATRAEVSAILQRLVTQSQK